MAGRGTGPDLVEALARGLDVVTCLDADNPTMTLGEVAGAAALTPKVLNLGIAYVASLGLWDIARPHLQALLARTGESSSMAQLDGSDIVYVARVSVPKLIALRGDIGTRFPAVQTSQGKVLLAALPPEGLAAALAVPSRAGLPPVPARPPGELRAELTEVRARGWALAD